MMFYPQLSLGTSLNQLSQRRRVPNLIQARSQGEGKSKTNDHAYSMLMFIFKVELNGVTPSQRVRDDGDG